MERYYAKLTVWCKEPEGHYGDLRVMFMSYGQNFLEATHEIEKFAHGLQVHPLIKRVTISEVNHEGSADDRVWIYDKTRVTEALSWLARREQ